MEKKAYVCTQFRPRAFLAYQINCKMIYNLSAPRVPFIPNFFILGSAPLRTMDIYEKWKTVRHLSRKNKLSNICDYLRDSGNRFERKKVLNIIKNLERRWNLCRRDQEKFKSKNQTWLHSVAVLSVEKTSESKGKGRPSKNFQDCGTRAKQKKIKKILTSTSGDELLFATQMSLRKQGRRVAANIIEDVVKASSSSTMEKYKGVYKNVETPKVVPMTPEEALGLIINTKSSKRLYLQYRESAKKCNANIYPSWHKILKAKLSCYPDPRALKISPTEVEVRLQDLLYLTAMRICQMQEEVLRSVSSNKLVLFCKWGIDGSSGQSNYRQIIKKGSDDSSVIIISLVPLQLQDAQDRRKILWKNPVPSSTRFCRAIKFIFAKETPELTVKETKNIQEQLTKIDNFIFEQKTISFQMCLTMIDGKVCNTLTSTKSSQTCYICHATPKQMNVLNFDEKIINKESFSFGLSTLHAWIRLFECCLHIGYRIEIKVYQAKGDNKEKVKIRKHQIVDAFKKELGILVDQPKPGYGSTNTGNTARTFFRNFQKSSQITGVSEELIRRFYVILQAISSGFEIDIAKFQQYTMDTAKLYVSLYPWYFMPPSVHKILIHGADISANAILPIGQLGEEAQEAKNKDFKFIREHGTRKHSAESTNQDLFNYFLLSSDPYISTLSLKQKNNSKLKFDKEALNLMKSCNIDVPSATSESESE